MSHKLTSTVMPSRSGHADYKELDKFDDVARYNTYTHNVAFYKDSPNRTGTPKPVGNRRGSLCKTKKITGKEKYLAKIIEQAPFIEKIYKKALGFRPRNTTINFPIIQHSIKARKAVYNDYHIRETNQGFARNSYGGFYTR